LHHSRREAMRAMLDEAASAVTDKQSPYAQRLAAIRMGWDRMELFLDIIDTRNRHDFSTAHAKMLAFRELSDEMVSHVLERGTRFSYRLLNGMERTGNSGYFTRFFARPIEQGYQRTVEQGRLVVGLADQWQFLIDPVEIGDIAGYYRPGELGGNWQPMLTSTRSWSDQGLHYYKGVAWYRQKVTIPAEFQGKPIYLWFGGVDQLAHVWINGQFVGTSRQPEEGLPGVPGSFRPFDMPATKAVKFGEENWVVVKIENHGLSELGTGGIVAPVMFWTPNDPDWKP
jgi:hypothetical protein